MPSCFGLGTAPASIMSGTKMPEAWFVGEYGRACLLHPQHLSRNECVGNRHGVEAQVDEWYSKQV